jgi:hypothetical protein
VVVAVALCGCGGSSAGTRAAPATSTAGATAQAFAGSAGAARFLLLVNDVCRVVRAGAPAPLAASAPDAAIRAHAAAGAAAAQKTLTAFARLRAPTTALARLRPLNADYVKLAGLYRTLLSAGAPRPHAFLAAIGLAEQRTAVAARAVGLAACAPATRAR